MWLHFLQNFNGKSVLLPEEWESSDVTRLFTDASGLLGFAAVFGSKWFADEWTQTLLPLQIAVKELFPIVLALEIWGSEMANRKILFMSDNMAVVEVINKQSSKEKCLMHLLRRFRIGAATHAAQLGYSESFIQHLGRWNSNALHRYIRIQSFQL